MNRGLRVARVGGIDVLLDWSLLIIVALVAMGLGGGTLPVWHPDWSPATIWLTAVAAAVLLILSVLLHEISHALVGRHQGLEVKSITLFVFGGLAHIEHEPPTWRAELWTTIVGPLVSLGIGIVCIAALYVGFGGSAGIDDPQALLPTLGPLGTLLLWLGPVNVVLAVFNLVPAFPLDGGRVLRALLWAGTGNFARATQWASQGGRVFAWLLIATGVAMALGVTVPVLGTGLIAGLWTALIGWFLHNAALISYQQVLAREALRGMRVRQLMSTDFAAVEPSLSVQALIDDYVMMREQRCFPVIGNAGFVGVVCLKDIRRVARVDRDSTTVFDIMTPLDRLAVLQPDDTALLGMATLSQRGVNQVPVIERGRLRGFLSREPLLRWLSLQGQAGAYAHGDETPRAT